MRRLQVSLEIITALLGSPYLVRGDSCDGGWFDLLFLLRLPAPVIDGEEVGGEEAGPGGEEEDAGSPGGASEEDVVGLVDVSSPPPWLMFALSICICI